MAKHFFWLGVSLMVIAAIPFLVAAKMRSKDSDRRRLHYIQDMDNQPKFKTQAPDSDFLDGRAMRPRIEGTVAREDAPPADPMTTGFETGNDGAPRWLDRAPLTVDVAFLEHGRERFNIYCAPCHGLSGYGDGIVNKRGMALVEFAVQGTSWVQPKNIHELAIREQPIGQVYSTITHGIRNMKGYAAQIPLEDRWAVAAYVKALQRSQHAVETDLTEEERANLETVVLPAPDVEEGQ